MLCTSLINLQRGVSATCRRRGLKVRFGLVASIAIAERSRCPTPRAESSERTIKLANGHFGLLSSFRGGSSFAPSDNEIDETPASENQKERVYVAVGSNLGDRFHNIAHALQRLASGPDNDIRLVRTSFLYETPPMYVTDQPSFLNGVVELETSTDMEPIELLRRLKETERTIGRSMNGPRNGPRLVDLDILLYRDGRTVRETNVLQIPHPRISEREFVLVPLGEDLATRQYAVSEESTTVGEVLEKLWVKQQERTAVRTLPLPRARFLTFNKTMVMGILNVTPDSFSDGGNYMQTDHAVEHALQLLEEGADILDIGGESTRPGAEEVSIDEELKRTIPVIQRIRQERPEAVLSIDTRHAQVAKAAIEAGADIVNDVSGGTYDPDMLAVVASYPSVPVILMHMRGTPQTMQSMTDYNDEHGVVSEVAKKLLERSEAAEAAGIPRWRQVLDPGIGFAKTGEQNLELLRHLNEIRKRVGNVPMLLGTSRKGFIGRLSGTTVASARDPGTIASSLVPLCLGIDWSDVGTPPPCNILRVHNVKDVKQAVVIMDAILMAR